MLISTKENLRQQIYKTICDDGNISIEEFSPNIIINQGKYEFYGYDAERLILYSADAIGLSREYCAKHFLYGKYFEPEGNTVYIFVIPFLIIFNFYKKIKNSILLLLNRPTLQKVVNEELKISLTVLEFADIMIDIWEQYQKENNK